MIRSSRRRVDVFSLELSNEKSQNKLVPCNVRVVQSYLDSCSQSTLQLNLIVNIQDAHISKCLSKENCILYTIVQITSGGMYKKMGFSFPFYKLFILG